MQNLTCRILYLWISLSTMIWSSQVSAEVRLVLEPANNSGEREIRQRLGQSPTIKTVMEFLNDTFITPKDINLHFGSYDKLWYEDNKIEIPYGFIRGIRAGYKNSRIPHRLSTTDEFIGNALFHVIFHEMAHALIEQYDLPVLGKEEDAADSFADVLLMHFFQKGDEIVISAADLYYMNSIHHGRLQKEDFWSEHGLDWQRYYARICHVYGSNPSKHLSLKRRVGFSDERARRCVMQYNELARSWLRLLEPAFKHDS